MDGLANELSKRDIAIGVENRPSDPLPASYPVRPVFACISSNVLAVHEPARQIGSKPVRAEPCTDVLPAVGATP